MTSAADFLAAAWSARPDGSLDGVHFIAEPGPKGWKHHSVTTIAGAVDVAAGISKDGRNAYFACSEYLTADNRKAENSSGAHAFWADIDCGAEKAASGKGYPTKKCASAALAAFCKAVCLPAPTIIVDSGNGLHCYWHFDTFISHDEWQRLAHKLKALTVKHGLIADPSRTADIASVLRVPGTLNFKDAANPKPVTTKRLTGAIDFAAFAAAIDTAMPDAVASVANPFAAAIEKRSPPPETTEEIARAKSMLAAIPADGERETWRNICWSVLATGWTCAEDLAREWSMTAPDEFDEGAFQKVVGSYKPDGGIGIGSLFHIAKQHGWVEPEQAWLARMNEKYAWVEKDAGVYRLRHRDFIAIEKFHTAHANDTVEIRAGNATKDVSVSRLWIAAAQRRQHTEIVLRPGEPEVTADGALNEWRGYAMKPVAGDVGPWKQLYARLFGNERFPLLWLAHKVQNPGDKKHTCLVIWSSQQGVGKNLLFEAVGGVFDPYHFDVITQAEVDDDFTGWMPGKVFVVADEVKAAGREKAETRIKLWTTATFLKSHDKGQPKRTIINMMDMVYLSNHADALFLSDSDRRAWVYEIAAGPLPEEQIQEFVKWRESGGLAYLLHYLLHVGLDGFDPKCRAPATDAKREMIEAGRSDLDRWCRDIATGGIPMGREVVTGEEVANQFTTEYPGARNTPQAATVSKVLVRMGAYARTNQVRRADGRKVRAIAVARPDFWKGQPESAWRDELGKKLTWRA